MVAVILGEKISQTRVFNNQGIRVPVSFIKTSPCYLVGIRQPSKHGYFALKLGFGQTKNIKKPSIGELSKAGIKTPLRFLKEFRLEKYIDENKEQMKFFEEGGRTGISFGETKVFVGEEIKPMQVFKKGDLVNISGKSKGKGFQGVVKRHKFAGGPRTHGQSDRERAPGSIGQTTTPGRVYKGKRMAGRMGQDRVTIKNLEIIEVKADGLLVTGLIPGSKKGLVEIKYAGHKKDSK